MLAKLGLLVVLDPPRVLLGDCMLGTNLLPMSFAFEVDVDAASSSISSCLAVPLLTFAHDGLGFKSLAG